MEKQIRCWWKSSFRLPDGGPSFSETWGTAEEVLAIVERRGFGPPKLVRGPMKEFRPSILATLPGGLARPDVFHSTCYIGFLAARSGVVTAEQLVCDGSALHELSHFLQMGSRVRGGKQIEHTLEAMRWLEEVTPGVPPLSVAMALPDAPSPSGGPRDE